MPSFGLGTPVCCTRCSLLQQPADHRRRPGKGCRCVCHEKKTSSARFDVQRGQGASRTESRLTLLLVPPTPPPVPSCHVPLFAIIVILLDDAPYFCCTFHLNSCMAHPLLLAIYKLYPQYPCYYWPVPPTSASTAVDTFVRPCRHPQFLLLHLCVVCVCYCVPLKATGGTTKCSCWQVLLTTCTICPSAAVGQAASLYHARCCSLPSPP
jgi:hypothetical protein